MRRVAIAFALSAALGGVALSAAVTRTGEAGPQSIVAHPAPPDLATLLQRSNPPLVCHLAHSAVRDRQSSELALTLDNAFEGTLALVTPSPSPPAVDDPTAPAAHEAASIRAGEAVPAPVQDQDAVTPADVMLMVAALALASLSVLVVRG